MKKFLFGGQSDLLKSFALIGIIPNRICFSTFLSHQSVKDLWVLNFWEVRGHICLCGACKLI